MLISWKLTTPTVKIEPDEEQLEEKKKNPILKLDDYDQCAGCKAHFRGYKPPPPPPSPVKVPAPAPIPPPVVAEPTPLTDDPMSGLTGALSDGLVDGLLPPAPLVEIPTSAPEPVPTPAYTPAEDDQEYRRGQLPQPETQGLGRKVKEFYSFNTISGELLHVTALQAILSVFELRMLKSSAGFEFDEANANLGFCQSCGTLISQLYKLHQEVADLLQKGSNVSKMIEFEEQLTDTQETDPGSLKKRRVVKTSSKVNGVSLMEEMDHDGGDSWMGAGGGADEDAGDSWNDDGGHDDSYSNYDNDNVDTEVNVKPRIEPRTVGIKITSVGSARTLVCEDMSSDGEGSQSGRKRRSTCKKVDYAKVLDGPTIDGPDDDEYIPEVKQPHERRSRGGSKTKSTARKKTAAAPPSSKGRGRPSKSAKASKVVVPPPKHQRERDPAFKVPAEKSSREATCQVCRKVFPSHYLAEHMNVAHNAVLGQPCLICGKFFESSYKAIKHLLTHVPEKAFGCSRCHATFKTAEERNSHTNTHTEAEKKLECPKCAQPFTSLLLMNKHEAQKHRQTKSFLCSICAKLLTGKDEWIQHILSHGPFQCYYCRDFLQPGEYKRHVQTVHMHAAGKARQSSSSASTSGGGGVIAEVTLD